MPITSQIQRTMTPLKAQQAKWRSPFSVWGYVLVLLLICLVILPHQLSAQEEQAPAEAEGAAPPAEGGGEGGEEGGQTAAAAVSGENFFRFGVMDVVSMRYNTPHPFEQMTNLGKFSEPGNVLHYSFDYLVRVNRQTEGRTIDKITHAIPPLSIEYVIPMDLFFTNAISIIYYHTTTLQLDAAVARTASGPKSQTPLLKMKTYYDLVAVDLHPFTDPGAEGLDVNFGLGVGKTEGAYEAGFRSRIENNFTRTTVTRNFSKFPITFKRIALDVNGDTFGFRFALWIINKDVVITNNPFVGNELTPNAGNNVNMAGVLLQAGMTFRL